MVVAVSASAEEPGNQSLVASVVTPATITAGVVTIARLRADAVTVGGLRAGAIAHERLTGRGERVG